MSGKIEPKLSVDRVIGGYILSGLALLMMGRKASSRLTRREVCCTCKTVQSSEGRRILTDR